MSWLKSSTHHHNTGFQKSWKIVSTDQKGVSFEEGVHGKGPAIYHTGRLLRRLAMITAVLASLKVPTPSK